MRFGSKSLAPLLSLIFLLITFTTFVAAQEKPPSRDYSWLNGKWAGRPPDGGELQMNLKVEKDNQVQGTGLIPLKGGRAGHPDVTGTVKGKEVRLETFFPAVYPQQKVIYNCKFAEGALQCKTRGGFQTTFKKVE